MMNQQYVWIQGWAYTPGKNSVTDVMRLVEPFGGIVTFPATKSGDLFRQIAEQAHASDKQVYYWTTPGRWQNYPAGLPDRYNLRSVVAELPEDVDWPNWTLKEVRDYSVSFWRREIDVLADHIDGISLDYVRYPQHQRCVIRHPDLNADQVTDVASRLAGYARGLDLDVIASVINARPLVVDSATYASHVVSGQDWPAWVRDGVVDRAYMMCGGSTEASFCEKWSLAPDEPGLRAKCQSICYPAGSSGDLVTADTVAALHRLCVEELGLSGLSAMVRHKYVQEVLASGVLDTWHQLKPVPEPKPGAEHLRAIAELCRAIAERLEAMASGEAG